MPPTHRRDFLGGLALGAGTLVGAGATAAPTGDGHAAGYDVAPGPGVPTLPRRPGEPVRFTFPLDTNPAKATSGGWAREVTARHLPISTGIAGAHLFLNPGGAREMHWHGTASEWAYVLAGRCQVVVLDPDGAVEVANFEAGDLWYFPRGHSHSIQTLGEEPCHAILAFDDGLYGEHGTFGISDWISALDPALLAANFGVPASAFAGFPRGETYINQGDIIPLDGPQARQAAELAPERSHRYRLMTSRPYRDLPGGTMHVASAREFPVSATMTAAVLRLRPGAMQELHWHPNANEWCYVARGRARATLFGPDKHLAVAEMRVGDCAYFPMGCGHSIQTIGDEPCEIVGVLDSGRYQESSLSEWTAVAPRHLLSNNFGTEEAALPDFPKGKVGIAAG